MMGTGRSWVALIAGLALLTACGTTHASDEGTGADTDQPDELPVLAELGSPTEMVHAATGADGGGLWVLRAGTAMHLLRLEADGGVRFDVRLEGELAPLSMPILVPVEGDGVIVAGSRAVGWVDGSGRVVRAIDLPDLQYSTAANVPNQLGPWTFVSDAAADDRVVVAAIDNAPVGLVWPYRDGGAPTIVPLDTHSSANSVALSPSGRVALGLNTYVGDPMAGRLFDLDDPLRVRPFLGTSETDSLANLRWIDGELVNIVSDVAVVDMDRGVQVPRGVGPLESYEVRPQVRDDDVLAATEHGVALIRGDDVRRFELPTRTCEIGGGLGSSSVGPPIPRQTVPCPGTPRHLALDGLGQAFVIDDVGALRAPLLAEP